MIVSVEALFFLIMGIVALFKPDVVPNLFGVQGITPDMRNEVRAVYGGFGIAVALTLLLTLWWEAIRPGVLLSVGLALLGMALGRLVSIALEAPQGRYPGIFLGVELVLGSALLYALSIA